MHLLFSLYSLNYRGRIEKLSKSIDYDDIIDTPYAKSKLIYGTYQVRSFEE